MFSFPRLSLNLGQLIILAVVTAAPKDHTGVEIITIGRIPRISLQEVVTHLAGILTGPLLNSIRMLMVIQVTEQAVVLVDRETDSGETENIFLVLPILASSVTFLAFRTILQNNKPGLTLKNMTTFLLKLQDRMSQKQ